MEHWAGTGETVGGGAHSDLDAAMWGGAGLGGV